MGLRQALRGAGFAAVALGAGAAIPLSVAWADGAAAKVAMRDRGTRASARALLALFGVELVVTGDPGPPSGGRVVVANHRSVIDIAVLISIFGGAMVSRADLERWPLIGRAARAAGTIFVDRASKASGSRAVDAMVARLAADDTVCVFPEGTTFVDDPVRPFKLGACVAALRARVAVIPVALVYPRGSSAAFGGETFVHHLARLASTPRTVVHVEIGGPMRPSEGEPVEAFSERCRAEVARLLAARRQAEP